MISKFIGLFAAGTIVLIISSLVPFGFIWSLNTLFNFHIEYSFINWLAMSFIYFAWRGADRSIYKGKDE
jgi:cobalamin biosynthesis protein CobD/CbiB